MVKRETLSCEDGWLFIKYRRNRSLDYQWIVNTLWNRGAERIFICPYGNIGAELWNVLSDRYGLSDMLFRIDNGLSEVNREIRSFAYLKTINWTDKDFLLIASDRPEIYYAIREELKRIVPRENLIDCCPNNPLCFDRDQRVAALAITAEEIYRNKVSGAVAEAGVYRGEFARFINMLFPERRLYLFDSFEGFSENSFDLGKDTYEQVRNWGGYKSDTSEAVVLRNLPYPDQAIIRKGYVPDTLYGIDDRFAFVNLDMDLYMPTYEALSFFWEKMNPGGYLFVHDVNNWDGCGKAVRDFCEEFNTGYICLNDRITAAVLKPYRGA